MMLMLFLIYILKLLFGFSAFYKFGYKKLLVE